jgi:hypothetical protein
VILLFVIIDHDPKSMFFLITLSYVGSGPVVTFYRFYRKRPLVRGPVLNGERRAEEKNQKGQSNL